MYNLQFLLKIWSVRAWKKEEANLDFATCPILFFNNISHFHLAKGL